MKARLIAWLLARRYRLMVEGLASVRKVRSPMLILFEHPAQADAFLLASVLACEGIFPKWLAARDFALLPFVYGLTKNFILPVPEEVPRRRRLVLLRILMEQSIATLRAGRSLALSPVGALLREEGVTRLGDRTGTAQILQAFLPGEVTVVTVRFEGLYGSSTSRAHTQQPPDPRALLAAIRAFAKGGLLFSVRRPVKLIFEVHSDFPAGASATVAAVNSRLETIFHDRRVPAFVPYNRLDRQDVRTLTIRRADPKPLRGWKRAWAIRSMARKLRGWPEQELGDLLPANEMGQLAREAAALAGKGLVPVELAPGRVLTCESVLNGLAQKRVVFEDREREGSLVPVSSLIG